jgi:hypothetical protein
VFPNVTDQIVTTLPLTLTLTLTLPVPPPLPFVGGPTAQQVDNSRYHRGKQSTPTAQA